MTELHPNVENAVTASRALAAFGAFAMLLMRSPAWRHGFLSDLEWLVIPGLAARQFSIAETADTKTGRPRAVAGILWARVEDAVDRRLSQSPSLPPRLRPSDWTSGERGWLIEAVGERAAASRLVTRLIETRFPETGLRAVVTGRDGRPSVVTLRSSDDVLPRLGATL